MKGVSLSLGKKREDNVVFQTSFSIVQKHDTLRRRSPKLFFPVDDCGRVFMRLKICLKTINITFPFINSELFIPCTTDIFFKSTYKYIFISYLNMLYLNILYKKSSIYNLLV